MPDYRLINAAAGGRESEVEELIKAGIDINIANQKNGYTALMSAALNGHESIVERLLQAGARVDLAEAYGDTALIWAAVNGHERIVERLLKAGASVDLADKNGTTALTWAAQKGHESIVERLLEAGASVDLSTSKRNTALMWAAVKGHEGIVVRLLKAGASVDFANGNGTTALIWAALKGHEGIVERLLGAGASVDLSNKYSYTALIWAARNGYKSIVERLLKAGASVDLSNENGTTALIWAARNGHEGIVERLLESRANVDHSNKHRDTALIWAALKGHEGIVERLLKAGANVHHVSNNNETAIFLAAENKHASVVKTLIKAGGFEPSQLKDNPDSLRFIQSVLLTAIEKKLNKLFHANLTPDQVENMVKKINNLTEMLKGDTFGRARKEIRSHLIALIKEGAIKIEKNSDLECLQAYLANLKHIRDNLHIIQPNPKEKEAKIKINSHISNLESFVDERKPLAEGSIASRIQLCLSNASVAGGFNLALFKKQLNAELSNLVMPDAEGIKELKKMVIKLTPDKRRYLRESLKELFDEATKKGVLDQWVHDLKNNHNSSGDAGKDIPFIAILRVSESGKKPDHDTKTWGQVIAKIKNITKMLDAEPSSKSTVSRIGRFGSGGKDETGQVSDPRINKHKLQDGDL